MVKPLFTGCQPPQISRSLPLNQVLQQYCQEIGPLDEPGRLPFGLVPAHRALELGAGKNCDIWIKMPNT